MARIKYSALIDEIQGSIGGTTFQRNQYGFSVRRKPNMIIPRRRLQARQKAILPASTRAWRQLTTSERDSWNTFAASNPQGIKNNPAVPMSGYAVFTRLNTFRQLAGQTLLVDAPSGTPQSGSIEPASVGLSVDPTIEFSWTTTGDVTGMRVLLFATSPIPEGVEAVRNRLRFIDNESFGGAGIETDEYPTIFGFFPSDGDRIGVKFILYNPSNGWVIRSISKILVATTI